VAAAALLVPTALAAPDNNNVVTQPVTCEAPLASVTSVNFIEQAASVAAFLLDGQVVVAKAFAFVGTVTFTIDSLAPIVVPEQDSFGGNGHGYQGRLVECSFETSFEDEFTLDKHGAASLGDFLGLDLTAYVGETVHVSETGLGTAWVVVPGGI
jgi:hypothetical protein